MGIDFDPQMQADITRLLAERTALRSDVADLERRLREAENARNEWQRAARSTGHGEAAIWKQKWERAEADVEALHHQWGDALEERNRFDLRAERTEVRVKELEEALALIRDRHPDAIEGEHPAVDIARKVLGEGNE